MLRSIRPKRATEQPRSAAAAALSASELRETGIAAAVCCSDWFGLMICHAPLFVAPFRRRLLDAFPDQFCSSNGAADRQWRGHERQLIAFQPR